MSSSRYPSGYCRARIYQVDTSLPLHNDPEYIRFPNDKRKKKDCLCTPPCTHVASAESKRDHSV